MSKPATHTLTAHELHELLARRERNGSRQGEAVLHLCVDGWEYAPLSSMDEDRSSAEPGVVLLKLHPDSDLARHLSGEAREAFNDVVWVPDNAATRCLVRQIEQFAESHDHSDPGSPGSHRVFVNTAADGEAPPGHLRVQVELLISSAAAIHEMTELWAGLKRLALERPHDG